MDSEAQESSYRKRFPKGKDWKPQVKNPYGFCGLNESSYHGMETIAISIEKYEEAEIKELKQKIEDLKNQYHFSIRNKHIEYEMLHKDFSKLVTAMNNLLQNNPDGGYIKMVLEDIGVRPK